jgi:hypothetical protein
MKHPQSVMIHASISAQGPGKVFILKCGVNMNTNQYLKVLEKQILPDLNSHKCLTFLQDRGPPHRVKQSISYLKEKKIKTIFLPGNSPDLNPIENCFGFVKYRLDRKDTRNLKKMKRSIKTEWAKLDKEYLKKRCDSMPKRLKEVIETQGTMTKY